MKVAGSVEHVLMRPGLPYEAGTPRGRQGGLQAKLLSQLGSGQGKAARLLYKELLLLCHLSGTFLFVTQPSCCCLQPLLTVGLDPGEVASLLGLPFEPLTQGLTAPLLQPLLHYLTSTPIGSCLVLGHSLPPHVQCSVHLALLLKHLSTSFFNLLCTATGLVLPLRSRLSDSLGTLLLFLAKAFLQLPTPSLLLDPDTM